MSKAVNSVTGKRQFRLPLDICERLAQQDNMTAFVTEAIRAAFRRQDMAQARAKAKQEGAE